MNWRRIVSQLSTRPTSSDRDVRESSARAEAAPRIAISEKVSSFFMSFVYYDGMRRLPVPADWLKHGDKGLESADWRLFPIPGGLAHLSLEAALGDLVLVPSQEMPELVEVGEARLVPVQTDVLPREIPEVGRVEEYPGRRRIVARDLGPGRAAREEAEEVGLEALGEDVRGGAR